MTKVTKFLLADDDRDDREMFSEALTTLDPNIICEGAEDGREALRLLSVASSYPNIIFVDINMPIMDGWELLRSIKGNSKLADIPVIIYSTSSRPKDRDIARDLGAMCFITKPDSFKLVKGMLEVVLAHLENNKMTELCGQIHTKLDL